MTIIGIDPGHGGSDPGAIGPAGFFEKGINLAIALKLADVLKLKNKEITVYLTRNNDCDVTLAQRSSFLNALEVDYVVSIHCNASRLQAPRYIATYIQGRGGNAEKLATAVQAELIAATGWPDGGVKVSNLHMTRETKAPAIVVECGFISNPEQEKMLANPVSQGIIARSIYKGILSYLGIDPTANWKDQIMAKAKSMGYIIENHEPDEPAPKWFVLELLMRKGEGS